jgi:hypothetical protein
LQSRGGDVNPNSRKSGGRRGVSRAIVQQRPEISSRAGATLGERRGIHGGDIGTSEGGAFNREGLNMSRQTGNFGTEWALGQTGIRNGSSIGNRPSLSMNGLAGDVDVNNDSLTGAYRHNLHAYNSNNHSNIHNHTGGIGTTGFSQTVPSSANKYSNSGEVDLATAESYVLLLNNVQVAPEATLLGIADMLRLRTIHVPYDDGENDGNVNAGTAASGHGGGSVAGVGGGVGGANATTSSGESKYLRVFLPQQFCVIAASSSGCVPGVPWSNVSTSRSSKNGGCSLSQVCVCVCVKFSWFNMCVYVHML